MNFCSKHSLTSNEQLGPWPKHSCTTAVRRYTENIRRSIISKNIGLACFVDLKKAFDTVNHDILLLKLKNYGIRGNVLFWCNDFLMNWKEHVSAILDSSDFSNLHCGVPQVSVLGPLLFLLYIFDLPSSCNTSIVCLVADDTTVFFSSQTSCDVQKILGYLNNLKEWLDENRLSNNESKCKLVNFQSYYEQNICVFGYQLKWR